MTSGDLFGQKFETWTPAQAKSFFRAGMVDDFFSTNISDDIRMPTIVVAGRQGSQVFVQLRAARDAADAYFTSNA
ncbi:hypothetical protein VOM14_28150 [Paraburkholderia sp. MPAMCS5]|uniref:hypothetical protein n=1 Tax=Paraburkholderia sp. MPAMCS5 TaxID=3112563 RepID=UPI002E19C310|nr:hypothetical protein [Paraburkholderia sp. MPAMCS5]